MASPFKVFRKNATIMLAGLVILSMFGFVVLPSALQFMGGGSGGGATGPVVTTTEYGDLDERQLQSLLNDHMTVLRFLATVRMEVMRAEGNFQKVPQAIVFPGNDEEDLVTTWLLAKRAQELGLEITDEAINDFIQELTTAEGQNLSGRDVTRILTDLRISDRALFNALRRELLARRLIELFQPALAATTPAQKWSYFKRLRQKARIEALPVHVADYVDEIPEPSDRELRAFFEEHKLQLPFPDSPDPGFRVPEQVAIEYLEANLTDWVNKIELTEEEIEQYYEQRKDDLFLAPPSREQDDQLPVSPLESFRGPVDSPRPGQSEGQLQPSESAEAPEQTAQDPADAAEQEPEGESAPQTDQAVGDSDAQAAEDGQTQPEPDDVPDGPEATEPESNGETSPTDGSADAPAEEDQSEPTSEAGDDADPASETPAADSGNQSRATSGTRFHLVALAEAGGTDSGEDEEAGGAEVTSQAPAEDISETEESAGEDTRAAEQTRQEEGLGDSANQSEGSEDVPPEQPLEPGDAVPLDDSEEEQAGAQPEDTEPATDGQSMDTLPEDGQAADGEPPVEPPAPKYRPLEEVRDEVITQIALERIDEVLREAEREMLTFRERRLDYLEEEARAKQEDRKPPAPPQFDLDALAQRLGLISRTLPSLPRWELDEREIGNSQDEDGQPLVTLAFDVYREYQPFRTFDADNNQYLLWVTERIDETVPEFTDEGVRERVLQAWKQKEARKLAEAEAERLAAEANTSGRRLTQLAADMPGAEAFETEPFSWLTYGEMDLGWIAGRPPEISPVTMRVKDPASGLIEERDAIQSPGNEFMRAVFRLEEGQAGAAWNQPQRIVYVVRLLETQPPLEELRERFVDQDERTYALAGAWDQQELFRNWVENLREEVGLKWNRPPRQSARAGF